MGFFIDDEQLKRHKKLNEEFEDISFFLEADDDKKDVTKSKDKDIPEPEYDDNDVAPDPDEDDDKKDDVLQQSDDDVLEPDVDDSDAPPDENDTDSTDDSSEDDNGDANDEAEDSDSSDDQQDQPTDDNADDGTDTESEGDPVSEDDNTNSNDDSSEDNNDDSNDNRDPLAGEDSDGDVPEPDDSDSPNDTGVSGDSGTDDSSDSNDDGLDADTSGSTGSDPLNNKIQDLDNKVFDTLSDSQKQIADNELKAQFIKLYNQVQTFITKLENLEPTNNFSDVKVFNYISNKLNEVSDVIKNYIIFTYKTKTYIENKTELYYIIWIVDRLVKLIDQNTQSGD